MVYIVPGRCRKPLGAKSLLFEVADSGFGSHLEFCLAWPFLVVLESAFDHFLFRIDISDWSDVLSEAKVVVEVHGLVLSS